MQFQIMTWVANNVRDGLVFGVFDKARPPAKLPVLGPVGHWAEYNIVDDRDFKDAEKAKPAIAAIGFYLVGGDVFREKLPQ